MLNGQTQQFRVVVEKDEDGLYVASVPVLTGCHTQAKSYEQVIERIKEAIELYLEVLRDKQQLDGLKEFQPRFIAIEDVAVKV